MIDFHSHILPHMDDGSGSTEESLQMLQCLAGQGIETVAATPHFYPAHRSPAEFLERRDAAWQHLAQHLTPELPEIRLGAETLYFPGFGRMEQLPQLCIAGTSLFLLEMPAGTWSDYMVQEVIDLSRSGSVTVLMAHIERYLPAQKKGVWDKLLENGVLMQCNAEFFLPLATRRHAARMLREGRIHLLGSDCHNTADRAPHMAEALQNIRRYAGDETAEKLIRRSRYYMGGVQP